LELLVVVAIIGLLASVMLISLARVRETARSFVCKNNLRTIAFDFIQFAEGGAGVDRGESDRLGSRGFRIEDFQEKLYGIDEFWKGAGAGQVDYDTSREPMICPAARGRLYRTHGLSCSDQAVGPLENVSIAFNMRLDRASVQIQSRWVLQPVLLSHRILQHTRLPIALDVDGRMAAGRGVRPYYTAPAAGDAGKYGSGQYWFPAGRHGRQANAAFAAGHVLSSTRPQREAHWDWRYQPPPG